MARKFHPTIFNFMEEKTYTCAKCKKEKKESDGVFYMEGTAFCCKECCGDPEKGEHKETKDNTCEFC